MAFLVVAFIALVLIGLLIYVLGAPDRHARMTEEEFEEEAQRASMLGAAMVGLDKALRPNRVEHVLIQKKRVEKGDSVSGDPPTSDKPRGPG